MRLGGMSKYVRPSFWLWVTETRCCATTASDQPISPIPSRRGFEPPTHRAGKGGGGGSGASTPRSTPTHPRGYNKSRPSSPTSSSSRPDFIHLKEAGAKGKWQHVIERDVTRAFGNMPPHKTGARYRQDSIVRALVSFGREEIMRNSRSYQATDRLDKLPEETEAKHFRLSSRLDRRNRNRTRSRSRNRGGDNLSLDGGTEGGGGEGGSSGSLTPTDTVSDWGGISPVGSLVSEDPSVSQQNISGEAGIQIVSYENGLMLDNTAATNTSVASSAKPAKLNMSNNSASGSRSDVSDMVLSGNALTAEMKVDLQNKLRSILHALAARHEAV